MTVIVLFGAVILRIMLIAGVAWWIVPKRAQCPHCAQETFGLAGGKTFGLLRLERRWCPCGWNGLSKLIPATPSRFLRLEDRPARDPFVSRG